MVTQAAHTARFVIGIIGNVISFCLFASPTPTFWGIIKKKTTEEFHPYPYIATVMNCLFWIFYGLPFVHPDSTLVITINGIGLAIELIYLAIFFFYTHKKYRIHIGCGLLAEIILLAIVASLTLKFMHTHERRSMVAGIICIIFGVIMYVSPLSIVKKVVKTKSVEFMPFWLSLAAFCNGLVWTVYALLQFDLYMLISNGLGAVSGAVQLTVYGYYYFKKTPALGEIHIGCGLLAEIILLAIVSSLTLKFMHTHERRSMVAGIICIIFGVIMYVSPLSIVKKVVKTKSVEFMPFWLSLAAFCNGLVWTVYALLQFDLYMLISNGLGAVSGAIQLTVYGYYYFKKTPAPALGEVIDKPQQIKLPV